MSFAVPFESTFQTLTGNAPFPWQQKWYEHLLGEEYDKLATCNLPTGLGKTAVLDLWAIALANNPKIARRLVYVVNRRTVVDQTTVEAQRIYDCLKQGKVPELAKAFRSLCSAKVNEIPFAISTLRGQFADNREWSADPSRPAIICGTVDMIGSRLLFSGYGCGFKSRPLHAGFFGQDSLLIHDEAHLEPAFQELLKQIEKEGSKDLKPMRIVELSATSRSQSHATPFGLTAEDRKHKVIKKRIEAPKLLRLHKNKDPKKLADELTALAKKHSESEQAVIVFARRVDDVEKILKQLPDGKKTQLTGTMRGFERESLIKTPIFQRFLPLSNRERDSIVETGTVYLVCTSAGEVGVNISADHLACDLSTFERMAQRFGRVNRFGDCEVTQIDIVHPLKFDESDKYEQRLERTLRLLKLLDGNGSPKALGELDPDARIAAFEPGPEFLTASDILFDAWALTTLRGPLPGRPPIEKYLHGIVDDKLAETSVAWREEVGVISGAELLTAYDPAELLEDYPLKPHELLRDNTSRVFDRLKKLKAPAEVPVWIVADDQSVHVTTLGKIVAGKKEDLNFKTVLLPNAAGGLDKAGFLSSDATAGENDVADEWRDKDGPLRKRQWEAVTSDGPKGMKLERTIELPTAEEEDAEPKVVWNWYVRMPEAPSARSRGEYPLQKHLDDAESFAAGMVKLLPLSDELKRVVVVAAKFHDLGKRRKLWQQSIGNRKFPDDVWAKSGMRVAALNRTRYRHEFGSLRDIKKQAEFESLTTEQQQLVLHLIAAHHGRARPHFSIDEAFDLEGSELDAQECAAQVAARFARLQRKYGRWGLAYLESLVRAVDILASQRAEGESK